MVCVCERERERESVCVCVVVCVCKGRVIVCYKGKFYFKENLFFLLFFFSYRMCRVIVGTLLEVGKGKMSPADLERVLELGHRSQAGVSVCVRESVCVHI